MQSHKDNVKMSPKPSPSAEAKNSPCSEVMEEGHNKKSTRQQLSLNGLNGIGLRRQPTKYPHGLSIHVQHIDDRTESPQQSVEAMQKKTEQNQQQQSQQRLHNYIPKMHRNGSVKNIDHQYSPPTDENANRKYKICTISTKPEKMSEVQARRFKYPLSGGNYYLGPQEPNTKRSLALLQYAQNYCRWKYLRWPSIFLASVLLFFGLITYCIWLHGVSVSRSQYLKRRIQFMSNDEAAGVTETEAVVSQTEDADVEVSPPTIHTTITDPTLITPTTVTSTSTTTTAAASIITAIKKQPRLAESTLLRAVGTRGRHQPKEQELSTLEFSGSKGVVDWKKPIKENTQKIAAVTQFNQRLETTTLLAEEAILPPESVVRFTSGHQNSFGVPIEDDVRILHMINGLFTSVSPVTSRANFWAKVSPTIPSVRTQTSVMSTGGTTVQENGCYSTKLPMCQGVLEYDLTINPSIDLTDSELDAFQTLIRSNCSARSAEFVCATLEPECRPSHIGMLPPCRRICKAILEACSILIANSDTLTATFDCNLYPDSNDPHKCEDPTRRRGHCYDSEYECYDRSCIPSQWQCDNIKDCANGEEEENCIVCDLPDEFRCRSNEKCVPESVRCDLKYDCFDGSDEEGCDEYGSGGDDDGGVGFDGITINNFPRVFSYATFLSPNQTNGNLYSYITATSDDEAGTKFQIHKVKINRTQGISREEVTNNVPGEGPKGFFNFRDSKEIMMTSDSENKFKYSSTRSNSSTTTPLITTNTNTIRMKAVGKTTSAPLQPAGSFRIGVTADAPKLNIDRVDSNGNCPPHQLRCVSGKCITVDQLCDKKQDCPDGSDELMCVHKVRSAGNGTSKVTTRTKETTRTTTMPKAINRNIRTTFKSSSKA